MLTGIRMQRGELLRFVPLWLFLVLHVFHRLSVAQSETSAVPDANPGRPTVSTPPTLPPVGYLQFENGMLLAENLGEFSNLFGVSQVIKFEHGNAVWNLWAVSYSVHKNLVLDVGVNHGLTRTSTQWEAFAGFTYVLSHRVWGAHRGGHSR
jgi:hypothetical protein